MSADVGDHVRRWVSSLLGRWTGSHAGANAHSSEPAADDLERRYRRFAERIMAMLAAQQALPAGQVNLIGLDSLRELMGGRWANAAERVHTVAASVLRRHLDTHDVFTRYGETEYLVVFGRLSVDAARAKAASIAREIHERCLGDPDLRDVHVRTAVDRVDGQFVFERHSVADVLSGLSSRLRDESVEVERHGGRERAAGSTEVNVPWMPARSRQLARGVRSAAKTEERPAPQQPQPDTDNSPAEDEAEALRNFGWAGVDELPPFPGVPQWIELGLSDPPVRSVFRPVWDVAQQAVFTYHCVPCRHHDDGSTMHGKAVLDGHPNYEAALARLDLEGLLHALQSLHAGLRHGLRFFVSVPMHYDTLAGRRPRDAFLQSMLAVPEEMRRYVLFELIGLPAGIPDSRFMEMLTLLSPFSRAVFVRSGLSRRGLERYAATGVHAVGADLNEHRRDEAALGSEIERFVEAAERLRLPTYLHGVETSSLAVQAAAAGVRYIEGARVGDDQPAPAPARRFAWLDFYSRHMMRGSA